MTPNDQRPDIPYSCRLAADSAQARLDPLNSQPLVPQIRVARRATRSFTAGSLSRRTAVWIITHIPSLTPLLNPHRASRTAGALPTAISCLGAFRTPAASACTDDRHRRRPKTCTKPDSCTATKVGKNFAFQKRRTRRPTTATVGSQTPAGPSPPHRPTPDHKH